MVGLIKNWDFKKRDSSQLGILAFEAAKTMSKLISLYVSLSDDEILRLMNDVVKSKGVAYLNSRDESFLLRLTWAEFMEDLDSAAATVSRMGKKCKDFGLNRFDIFYRDLKLGFADLAKMLYGSRVAERKVRKMEKLVETTSSLRSALESLTELEISERKLKQWKTTKQAETAEQRNTVEVFYQKLEKQRKEVGHFREVSLWSKDIEKIVDLMAKIVCVLYVRISHVSGNRKKPPTTEKIVPFSGPIVSTSKPTVVRFYSRRIDDQLAMTANKVLHSAGPRTVGGSGLAMRYANVILSAAEHLESNGEISKGARETLYEMLPENLKAMVGAKLSRRMKEWEEDRLLAEGWREAVEEMMTWLEPMARDTVTWQMERSLEKVMRTEVKRRRTAAAVVMAQTLHFADKEKTEAAIVEVLVGLSCVIRFENRKFN